VACKGAPESLLHGDVIMTEDQLAAHRSDPGGCAMGSDERPGMATMAFMPPLAAVLGTQPLPWQDLAIVTGLSLLGYAGIRLDRKLHPR
jgi:hypothetical protein